MKKRKKKRTKKGRKKLKQLAVSSGLAWNSRASPLITSLTYHCLLYGLLLFQQVRFFSGEFASRNFTALDYVGGARLAKLFLRKYHSYRLFLGLESLVCFIQSLCHGSLLALETLSDFWHAKLARCYFIKSCFFEILAWILSLNFYCLYHVERWPLKLIEESAILRYNTHKLSTYTKNIVRSLKIWNTLSKSSG